MAQTENQKKLLKILNEIFQLDQSDLDFGIYRIMNTKSREINEFLDKDLLSSVASAFSSNDNSAVAKELDELIKTLTNAGMNADDSPKVQELKDSLSSSTTSSNLENDVFSHLANFFKRYYKDGDFVSLRRYKKDTYAIPYEGEEVKLHWANSDQYYIKSGEYFRDYSFKVGDKVIHFKLKDAETESNNNKATSDKERRFVILEDNPCEVIEDELYINFEYKAIGKENQDKLNEKAIAKALDTLLAPKLELGSEKEFTTVLSELAPTQINKKRTIFEKHLKSYTSRNSFDYFIHKDLGGFLGRELDFYIKNEMLFLDDIMDSPIKYEEVMGKIKIFKEVAGKIIAFLTQLEELQKKLWEKKKFVIETNYCITLDKINEDYYEEIFENKEQLAEWETLFGSGALASQKSYIEAIKGGTKVPLPDELKYLVLDTKFFDMKFKYKLLSEFDNLDEDIDGVLINSENFGALNLLQSRYKEQVKTVYIDPPYNTGNDGFLYNDSYKHSSWLSFINDRLSLSKELMSDDGVIFSSIDDEEQTNLRKIKGLIFNDSNYIAELTWEKKKKGTFLSNSLTNIKETIIVFSKNKLKFNGLIGEIKTDVETYPCINSSNKRELRTIPKGIISKYREPDYFLEKGSEISVTTMSLKLHSDLVIKDSILVEDLIIEGNWRYTQDNMLRFANEGDLYITQDLYLRRIVREARYKTLKDLLPRLGTNTDLTYSHFNINNLFEDGWGSNEDGEEELRFLLNQKDLFSYPKPTKLIKKLVTSVRDNTSTILDYFAGSGTTGHSVINLNREDNGKRKYILVEMGEYFDSVTKPRIQKVIYTDSWNESNPTTKNGVSQIFKYFKLESYEDTLNNLEFTKTEEQQKTLDFHPEAKEDYILNYSLDVESQGSLLSIDTFSTPFNYKLKIATSSVGETKDTNIDLVETFNYLLGLVVKRIELLKGYLVVEGQNLKKEKILIIWRDGQSSDSLNEFFKKMDWSVYDREFDTIYVNGDNNLDNLRLDVDHFKVKLIEQEFKKLMFGE